MSSRLDSVTPPMWIFAFTLVLIIITGGLVGSSPCERSMRDCETLAREEQPMDATLRQQYVDACSAQACSPDRTAWVLPLSILILGFVLYRLWLRHGDPENMKFFRDARSFSDPMPVGAGPAPTAREADPVPPAPKQARQATKAPRAKDARKADDPGKPGPAAAPAKEAPATAPEASPGTSTAPPAERELDSGARQFCLDVLTAGDAESRDAMAGTLNRLTGGTDPDLWKGAPLADLQLLARSIAIAALAGPSSSKYRRALDDAPAAAAARKKAGGDLQELTKKELHQQCVQTLQQDLQALTRQGSYPDGVEPKTIEQLSAALQAQDALGGLSRCSKTGLVHLASFLA
jgi:hypothetical protein